MTKLIYLSDSYKRMHKAKISAVKIHGNQYEVILDETIFYPQGGGQPADRGKIKGKKGELEVTHVRMKGDEVIHEGKLTGVLKKGDQVELTIDWQLRYNHMRLHSAGHVLHEIVMQIIPGLTPMRGEHGKQAYIEYKGSINPKLKETLEKRTNMLIAEDRDIKTTLVTLEELKKQEAWVPERLPQNKLLRILQIEGFPPIPDGGTQVATTGEIGSIKVTGIEQLGESVRVHYAVDSSNNSIIIPVKTGIREKERILSQTEDDVKSSITLNTFKPLLLELQSDLLSKISQTAANDLEELHVKYFGTHGTATVLIKKLKDLPPLQRKDAGLLVNEFKRSIEQAFQQKRTENDIQDKWYDTSLPSIRPPEGHLHLVTQAIIEISRIFERIGFNRVRHPEVDWDWYAFESLNMPPNHPARDEWETFFIRRQTSDVRHQMNSKIVLTPHTSNGQVREMEKGNLPIRMINIAKCYRRQEDVSHTAMFHQFEGLYVDKNVSIGDLKGVMEFFFKHYYGPDRKARIRPFHFQFTEPSFEVDVSCGVCAGHGCRLCKEGWLELGGAGMVHPSVLKNGGIDPDIYNGFAFGWGIERVVIMKISGIDDNRQMYSTNLRFLEQF